MMTVCPLCQQVHAHPLQDKLCKLRLKIINLRLQERELVKQLTKENLKCYRIMACTN